MINGLFVHRFFDGNKWYAIIIIMNVTFYNLCTVILSKEEKTQNLFTNKLVHSKKKILSQNILQY